MKRLIALFLMMALLCGAFTIAAHAEDEAWMQKIDPEILVRMEKPGEAVGAWMWYSDSAVIAELGLTDIRFVSSITGSAIVNMPKSTVYAAAQDSRVLSLDFYALAAELPDPPEGVEYRFGDALLRYIDRVETSKTYAPRFVVYEELYGHQDDSGDDDWAIIFAQTGDVAPWYGMAIIGNRVIVSGTGSYFTFGMALYDAKADTFYDLSEMNDYSAYDGLAEALDLFGRGKLLGDLDGDDRITIMDATIIQRCEVNLRDYPESDWIQESEVVNDVFKPIHYYSDFNRDGEHDIMDATCIQRYLVGATYPKYR